MKFNLEKYHVVPVTRNKTVIKTQYMLHGQILETVSQAKYLGITITSDLRWNAHINNMSLKANRSLGFLRRNIPQSLVNSNKNSGFVNLCQTYLRKQLYCLGPLHLYTDKPTRNDPTLCSSICPPPQYLKCNRYAPDIRMEIQLKK